MQCHKLIGVETGRLLGDQQ